MMDVIERLAGGVQVFPRESELENRAPASPTSRKLPSKPKASEKRASNAKG
jgi:hypothetical protein